MSRIHEALKKAEQERLTSQGAGTVDTVLTAPVLATADAVAAPLPAPAAVPAAVPATMGAEAPTPEMLMRCQQQSWRPDPQRMPFSKNGQEALGLEQFRTLRSRLYQIREKRPFKTVLVGSALPGEGKSFVSANLAQSLVRQHGRRVLLIDGDLRKPFLHDYLGTIAQPGLSDYLRGDCDELSVVQRGPIENLFFIPGGKHVTNPAELIANERFKLLLQKLSPAFDWVVIDSSPVVPVSDASLVANLCDGVLLVVQAASTPFEMAQRARQEFGRASVLGVVLNRVAPGVAYPSYYYGGYGKAKGADKG